MENKQELERMIRSMVMNIMNGTDTGVSASEGSLPDEPGVFSTVNAAVAAAKQAQIQFEECTLATRGKAIEAIRQSMRPLVNKLAQMTYDETGMGRVADKIIKLNLTLDKTPGVEDL